MDVAEMSGIRRSGFLTTDVIMLDSVGHPS